MSAGEDTDLALRFFGKAKSQVYENDMSPNWNQVKRDRAEQMSQTALCGPRQPTQQTKNAETDPHGPVLGEPEVGLFAGAGHCPLLARDVAIELGIERWIVVHLELEIDRERASSRDDIGKQFSSALGEIGALRVDSRQFF